MRNIAKLFFISLLFTGFVSCTNVYFNNQKVTPPVVTLECDSSGVMFVRWSPSNDAVSYSISKDGVGIRDGFDPAAEGGCIFVDTNIKPGTTYSYTVIANTSAVAAETSPIASGCASETKTITTPASFTPITPIKPEDIELKISGSTLTVLLNKKNPAAQYEFFIGIKDPIEKVVLDRDITPFGTLFYGYNPISSQSAEVTKAGVYSVVIKETGLAPGSAPASFQKEAGQIDVKTTLAISAKASAAYETGDTKAKISWDMILNGTTAIPYNYYHVYRKLGTETDDKYAAITVTFGKTEEVLEERDPSTGTVTKKGVPAQHYFIDDFGASADTTKAYTYLIRVRSDADMIDSDKDIIVTLEAK